MLSATCVVVKEMVGHKHTHTHTHMWTDTFRPDHGKWMWNVVGEGETRGIVGEMREEGKGGRRGGGDRLFLSL